LLLRYKVKFVLMLRWIVWYVTRHNRVINVATIMECTGIAYDARVEYAAGTPGALGGGTWRESLGFMVPRTSLDRGCLAGRGFGRRREASGSKALLHYGGVQNSRSHDAMEY
jgi:hypothetical protein